MSTQTPDSKEGIARSTLGVNPRLDHVPLGIDARGYHHHLVAETLTVYVISDTAGLVARFDLRETPADSVSEWLDAVEREHGAWCDRRWFADAAQWVASA